MMRLVGSVVDAAIGCLVQSILGSFFTEQMEAWTREIGLAEDIEKLEFEMTAVERLLAAAEGRSIDNKLLAQSLGSLRELLYDAEDVMDELDYHRLKHQIEKGEGCSAAAGNCWRYAMRPFDQDYRNWLGDKDPKSRRPRLLRRSPVAKTSERKRRWAKGEGSRWAPIGLGEGCMAKERAEGR